MIIKIALLFDQFHKFVMKSKRDNHSENCVCSSCYYCLELHVDGSGRVSNSSGGKIYSWDNADEGTLVLKDANKERRPIKPKMKRDLTITSFSRLSSTILFYSSKGIAEQLEEFGYVFQPTPEADRYQLNVDRRFDFDEVLEYARSLE